LYGSIIDRDELEKGGDDVLPEAVMQVGPIFVDEKEQGLNVEGANIRGCLASDRVEEGCDRVFKPYTFALAFSRALGSWMGSFR
jgi:hypothetical protein